MKERASRGREGGIIALGLSTVRTYRSRAVDDKKYCLP